MTDLPMVLRDLSIVLAIATAVALLFGRLHLSVVAAFLVAGAILGPTGAGLVAESGMVDSLAEIGVALLLFTVGLEISFANLGKMRLRILQGGGVQLSATILITVAVLSLAMFPLAEAIFIGFVLSLSSTAIVLKVYADQMEIDSAHGKISIGILLFQDLAVIPMMLLIPSFRQWETAQLSTVAFTLAKAGVGVVVILLASRFVIPLLLKEVIRLNSREILAMTVMCLILGTAWVARWWGLSLAMGAFLAGMVISESEYVHEIAAQIFPFRDVFNGVFFISVGMLLDLPFLLSHLPMILLVSVGVVVSKAICAGAAIRTLKYPWRVSVIGAIGLAQIGEFSFLLMSEGFRDGLVGTVIYQYLLATAILTMVATPFLMRAAPWAGRFFVRHLTRRPEPEDSRGDSAGAARVENHVIISGYGMNGKNLARVLRSTHVPYVVVDLNDALVREGREAGEPIFYGDVNNPEILDRVGVGRARMLVLAISDPMATRRAVAVARRANPRLGILVRTRYVADVDDLIALGANAVIPEEFETSVEIFSRVLREYHVPDHVVSQQEALIRSGTYRILRERVSSSDEGLMSEFELFLRQKVIEVFYVSPGSPWAGLPLGDLPAGNGAGIVLLAVLREDRAIVQPSPEERIEAGDKLVFFGGHAPLATVLEELSRVGR
ncbi:cation:proton antiporter [Candidatus Deferrimicrobium sp.]|uniref:cation:proton antiporter domain-containing protein n=1 Tax=Candidatus Deferrimicrobium sp. TaxID=3060586 RepID=UPI002ED5054F